MVLDRYRSSADWILDPLARRLQRLSPNFITFISLALSGVVVLLYYFSDTWDDAFLVLAAVMVLLSSLFDALDGMVARITGKACKKGDLCDHVCDRYADILLVGGLFLTGRADILLVLLALTGVFMTSYMGTQAQALGATRNYGGLLGRADRLVILVLVLIVQYFLVLGDMETILWELSLIEWMLISFAVLGHITALSRTLAIAKDLDKEC